MDVIWKSARVALAVGLLVLLVLGTPRGPEPGEPLLVDGTTTVDDLGAILVRDTSVLLTYADSVAPTRAVATLLASAARGGSDVTLEVPGQAGMLRVDVPDRPVARRRTALRVSVRGAPDTEVPVTIKGQTGAPDSLLVPIGPDGRGAASVAVEPSRPGAASWTVRTPGAHAVAHAWVRPETSVRVLVWSGAPGWESRWLVRALEAAGMRVVVRQDLGRELAVRSEGARAPSSLVDLEAYDVLALVGVAADSADALARRWVAERGGGLLLVGVGGSAPALAAWVPRGAVVERPASDLGWEGPAEIVPLPDAEIVTRVVAAPGAGAVVARAGALPTDVFARAAYLGRGRVFTSGIETWPWAMEAGLGAEHEAYWESVVEWLAGGLTDDVSLAGAPAQPWVRWVGRLEGAAPDVLTLRRPREAREPTEGEPLPVSAGSGSAAATLAFVPVTEGAHALELTDSAAAASPFGTVAVPPSERLTWTAAAAELGAAGARVVRAGSAAGVGRGHPVRPSRAFPWIAFVLLAGLAVSAWTARRVAGRP